MKTATVLLVAVLLCAGAAFAANTITVDPAAAINGNYGLSANFDGTTTRAYVVSYHPVDETSFSIKFRIGPNSINMLSGNFKLYLLRGHMGGPGYPSKLRVGLIKRDTGAAYRAQVYYYEEDGARWKFAGDIPINDPNGTPEFGLEWTSSTSSNSNDGEIKILKNGVVLKTKSGIDIPWELDYVWFGAPEGSKPSQANGSVFLDDYVNTR